MSDEDDWQDWRARSDDQAKAEHFAEMDATRTYNPEDRRRLFHNWDGYSRALREIGAALNAACIWEIAGLTDWQYGPDDGAARWEQISHGDQFVIAQPREY